MKRILIGILTIFITIAFMILGYAVSLKTLVVDTASEMVREKVTNAIMDYANAQTNLNKEEVKKEITKVLQDNPHFKKTVDGYFDQIIDIIADKEVGDIDLKGDLEPLANDILGILKEYNITITEDEKEELLSIVASKDVNDTLKDSLIEAKNNMSNSSAFILDFIGFSTSLTFKLILVFAIALMFIFIALLKKSAYKWLSNLASTSIICGVTFSFLLPVIVDKVSKSIADSMNITIPVSSITMYGYILIAIGVVAIISNLIISIIIKNKKTNI